MDCEWCEQLLTFCNFLVSYPINVIILIYTQFSNFYHILIVLHILLQIQVVAVDPGRLGPTGGLGGSGDTGNTGSAGFIDFVNVRIFKAIFTWVPLNSVKLHRIFREIVWTTPFDVCVNGKARFWHFLLLLWLLLYMVDVNGYWQWLWMLLWMALFLKEKPEHPLVANLELCLSLPMLCWVLEGVHNHCYLVSKIHVFLPCAVTAMFGKPPLFS